MKQTSNSAATLSPYAWAGRLLISFIAVLLVVMPWTEHFWHFDGFLVSGQDFEFGLLALASFFSLVLVLSKRRRQSVVFIAAVRSWLLFLFPSTVKPARRTRLQQVAVFLFPDPYLSSPALRLYNLPIQI